MQPVLFLYRVLITLLTPFVLGVAWLFMRKNNNAAHFAERFGFIKLNKTSRQKSVWFHAASVGEVKSIKNLTDTIRKQHPDCAIIVSTFTTTGRKEAEIFINADERFLLPIENAAAVKHIINLLGVKAFFIVDTEIWPNLIATASENTATFMINARMTEKTCTSYYKYRFFFRPLLKKFRAILTKSDADARMFGKVLGSDKTIADIGNIKFQTRKKISDIEQIKELQDVRYLLAASTHADEEMLFIEAFQKFDSNFDKLIIAPRHPQRAQEIKESAAKLGIDVSLLSESGYSGKIIIADAFGLLEKLYVGAAKIFIGGSIAEIGGHNIYEALQFEKYVATGPNMHNFAEIYATALKQGVLKTLQNNEDITAWAFANDTGGNFGALFAEIDKTNEKTLEKIIDLIKPFLSDGETKQ